jgi:hypothetical protein
MHRVKSCHNFSSSSGVMEDTTHGRKVESDCTRSSGDVACLLKYHPVTTAFAGENDEEGQFGAINDMVAIQERDAAAAAA